MKDFASAIPTVIAILGFLVAVIGQWKNISEIISRMLVNFNQAPLMLLKFVVISVNGMVVASLYWILVDYLTFGHFDSRIVLPDILTGAGWGIPIALFGGSLSKNINTTIVSSIFIGVLILILISPAKVIAPTITYSKIYALSIFWMVASISIVSGYVGYKTKAYLDQIFPKQTN